MERLLSIYLSVALIGTPSSCKPSIESLIGGSQLLGVRSEKDFESMGCWKDAGSRAIDGYLGNLGIQGCYEKAKSLGYDVFAVQYGGQCFTTATAGDTYKKYGPSTGCSDKGTGGTWCQEVYKMKKDEVDVPATKTSEASECFEYKGSYDGKCMVKPDGTRIRASRISGSYWPDDLAKPEKFDRNAEGLASAKEWCNAEPKCMGFGVHYHYDRYYIYGAPNAGPEISSLVCNDPENNKCGDREPTNGCYVKYRCGESSPYDANVPTPEPSEEKDCSDSAVWCVLVTQFVCEANGIAEACPKTCKTCSGKDTTEEEETATDPWTLVMKIAEDETFGYSSSYWEDDTLLNQNSPVDERVNAKYQAFLNVPFTTIRMCVENSNSNCVTHTFDKEWRSAKELFRAGRIKDTTVDQANILIAFNPTPGDYQDCGMQNPGFNIVCRDNNKARWGYCVNCASQGCQLGDNNDADAAIGIGLSGQNTSPEMGAGWTAYFADGPGQCNARSKQHKFVWLSIEGN